MTNIIWLGILAWIFSGIVQSIDAYFKSRRVVTVKQMADNVTKGLSPFGDKMTDQYIQRLLRNSLEMNHFRDASEAAQKEINKRSTGQIKDNSRNLAKPKKNRPVKLF